MKTKDKFIIALFLPLFGCFQSCKDIIAADITGQVPIVIIPGVEDTVNVNPVHFKWEKMEGATKYHLEVVSPSFSSISFFSIDTIISGTDFFAPLDSSEYDMRLTALNAGYESNPSELVHFWVGVSPSTSNSQVVLLSPENNSYYNDQFDGFFDWQNTSSAQSYEFYLKKGTSFESGNLVEYGSDLEISSKTVNSSLFSEGEYHWGVRAYFSNGTESVLSKFKFYIDTTSPTQPTLQQPQSNSPILPGVINFVWDNGSDQGIIQSPVVSILEVSSTISFSQPDLYFVNGNTTTLTINGTLGEVFYWRVRNRDDAGNFSVYSSVFNFSF